MKLYIKYMVSMRCKMLVKGILGKLEIAPVALELGMVEIVANITDEQNTVLKSELLKAGLELLEDQKAILIDKVKAVIIEMVHYADELPKEPHSTYISRKLEIDYNYLADLFAEVKGVTIQEYITYHKIERAKELLLYEELNLTEISYRLDYSSVAHLSAQFKKVTGLAPSYFRGLHRKRKELRLLANK